MTTNSYPAVGTGGLTDSQWSTMYGAVDGIVEDYVGNALNLQRFNSTDICRVNPGKVKINGYVLDITENEDLYCAPVVLGQPARTYYIVAQYNPALNVAEGDGTRSPAGPCRLLITNGAPDTSGGKQYVYLYSLVRSGSQLVSETEKTDYRRWIGQAYEQPAYAPAPSFAVPRGSVVHQTGIAEWSVRTINAAGDGLMWQSMSRGSIAPIPISSSLVAYDRTASYQVVGGRVYLEGNLKRTFGGGADFNVGDTALGTLPVGARPGGNVRFVVELLGSTAYGTVRINSSGVVNLYIPEPASVVDLSGISFRQEN